MQEYAWTIGSMFVYVYVCVFVSSIFVHNEKFVKNHVKNRGERESWENSDGQMSLLSLQRAMYAARGSIHSERFLDNGSGPSFGMCPHIYRILAIWSLTTVQITKKKKKRHHCLCNIILYKQAASFRSIPALLVILAVIKT